MLALDVFLYVWIGLICCMCSRLCYEEHTRRNPTTKIRFSYLKRKFFCMFQKNEPLISDTEMSGSVIDVEEQYRADDPPKWVQESV